MENKKMWELMNQNGTAVEKILACNEYTKKFGVTLTNEDVVTLMEDRKDSLREQQRIEFGEGILSKLVYLFCDSPYIYQDNYVDTIAGLQDIFYLYKNESNDVLSDDELLEYMKNHFDGDCQGSLEFLEETCLEEFARCVRNNSIAYLKGTLKND